MAGSKSQQKVALKQLPPDGDKRTSGADPAAAISEDAAPLDLEEGLEAALASAASLIQGGIRDEVERERASLVADIAVLRLVTDPAEIARLQPGIAERITRFRAGAKQFAPRVAESDGALQPCMPAGYVPVGEIEVLAESAIARVVTDGVLVWKEAI